MLKTYWKINSPTIGYFSNDNLPEQRLFPSGDAPPLITLNTGRTLLAVSFKLALSCFTRWNFPENQQNFPWNTDTPHWLVVDTRHSRCHSVTQFHVFGNEPTPFKMKWMLGIVGGMCGRCASLITWHGRQIVSRGGSRSQRHDRQAIANDMEWMDTDQRFIQFICDDTIEMASRRGRDGKVV